MTTLTASQRDPNNTDLIDFLALRRVSGRRRAADLDIADQARSNRSRFMTLSHAATKSCTNFSCESSLA